MSDERDLRDPALDAAWRAQSTEMPPPPLDAAILAAAHRAVKSAPEKIGPGREATRPWRWWTPLAAAAVIGVIAIGALQLLPQEPDPTKVVVSDMPTTGAKPDAPAAPSLAATSPSPDASASSPTAQSSPSPPPPSTATAQSARAMAKAESPPQVAAPAPAQKASRGRAAMADPAPRPERPMAAPPPAAPAEASSDFAAREDRAIGAARPAPEPFPARSDTAPPAAAAAAPMLEKRAMRDETLTRSPDEFVARIRSLFAEANMAQAQRELVAFRAAYADADARLPTDLRPWAATVPRN